MSQILRVLCIIAVVAVLGCHEKKHEAPAAPTSAPASQAAVVKANCVICGDHEIDVEATTPTVEYHGKRYYFCSDYCKTEFGKDPEKWVALDAKRKAERPASH